MERHLSRNSRFYYERSIFIMQGQDFIMSVRGILRKMEILS